ncbi:hypothetical protein TYRP_023550, partial [Tyrophagus putrescentiae]
MTDNESNDREEDERHEVPERQNDAPASANERGHRRGPGRPPNARRRVTHRWESEGTRFRRQANYMAMYRENQPEDVAAERRRRKAERQAQRRAIPEVRERERLNRAAREGDPAQRAQRLEAQRVRNARRRADDEYAAQERERNREWWRRNASIATQAQFIEAIAQGPTEVCSCCALIFIAAPTATFTREQLHNRGLTDAVIEACLPVLAAQHQQQETEQENGNRRNEFKLCTPCRKKLFPEQKSMPPLCAASFILAPVPNEVADLNRNEEALVIPNQHALTRITSLKHRNADGGDGSHRSSTYVLSTVDPAAALNRTFPREHSKTAIIQVPLVDFHNPEDERLPVYDVVRPANVEAAAQGEENNDYEEINEIEWEEEDDEQLNPRGIETLVLNRNDALLPPIEERAAYAEPGEQLPQNTGFCMNRLLLGNAEYIRLLFKLMASTTGSPFGAGVALKDYYIRVEFGNSTGLPHVHCLLWVEDDKNSLPVYDNTKKEKSAEQCVKTADRFISCSVGTTPEERRLVRTFQVHWHSHCCKQPSNSHSFQRQSARRTTAVASDCRFGYPLPPMPTTILLQPLTAQNRTPEVEACWATIAAFLSDPANTDMLEEITFEQMIACPELGPLTLEEYLIAVRCSLRRPTIFLKRSPAERFINAYNPTILRLFQANMDIQLVLHPWAVASYISKCAKKALSHGISRFIRQLIKEIRRGNVAVRERLHAFANRFSHATEFSVYEAVYYILGLAVSRSSRKVSFINTNKPERRTRMLKPRAELQKLDGNSTDIYMPNDLVYYAARDK